MILNNTPLPKFRIRYADGSGHLELPTEIDFTKQIFTHRDKHGVQRCYNTVKLYEIAEANNFLIRNVKIDYSQAAWISRHAGVNKQHIKNMTPKRTTEPGLLLQFEDNSHLIIDGNHRYLKRFSMGRPTMRFYIFTEDQAMPAKLLLPENIGSTLLRNFS